MPGAFCLYAAHGRQLRVKVPSQPDGVEA